MPASARRPWWLWGICALTAGVVAWLTLLVGPARLFSRAEHGLQRFGEVPNFVLIERSGQQVTRADLLGKVWIVNFIFTRCAEECPLMSGHMARLQDALATASDVRLVSITVDPEHDTPEVLARYAERFAARPQRWWFLTGDKAAIYRLVREGFHLGLVDPTDATRSSAVPDARRSTWTLMQFLTPAPALAHSYAPVVAHHGEHAHDQTQRTITHNSRFVLVDRQGHIRNYYDSTDPDALQSSAA